MIGPFYEFPTDYKKAFQKEISRVNFIRSRQLALVLFCLNLIFIFFDIMNYRENLWHWNTPSGYLTLFYLHIILGLMMLLFLIFPYIKRSKSQRAHFQFQTLQGNFFPFFGIIYGSLVSINDQRIHGQITVFILVCFLIAINNYLNPKMSILIYTLSWLLLILGVTHYQLNHDILKGHYINGTISMVFAVYLSMTLYKIKIKNFISRKTIELKTSEVEAYNNELIMSNIRLEESLQALDESQNVIFTLASALESKDYYTRGHSERVANYALHLARSLELSEHEQQIVWRAAQLHDIGKIGIPDAILNKPGILDEDEWTIMRSHPEMGEKICSSLSFARDFLPMIRHHHERFDGTGYPDGLRGEEIPYLARIVSIADAVDAITSQRSYRPTRTPEEALEELARGKGSQFDPHLVQVFIKSYLGS